MTNTSAIELTKRFLEGYAEKSAVIDFFSKLNNSKTNNDRFFINDLGGEYEKLLNSIYKFKKEYLAKVLPKSRPQVRSILEIRRDKLHLLFIQRGDSGAEDKSYAWNSFCDEPNYIINCMKAYFFMLNVIYCFYSHENFRLSCLRNTERLTKILTEILIIIHGLCVRNLIEKRNGVYHCKDIKSGLSKYNDAVGNGVCFSHYDKILDMSNVQKSDFLKSIFKLSARSAYKLWIEVG